MAPSTRMPDSLISQFAWNRISFNIGRTVGKTSSRNTFAKTSKAAAEHFPAILKHTLNSEDLKYIQIKHALLI